MRTIIPSNQFKRDLRLMKRRGLDLAKLQAVIEQLAEDLVLAESLKDHPLIGNYKGYRECHIEPNWLLIYQKEDDEVLELHELLLARTGTHSDLFD
jgi:mRNA interferase YafQ